MVWGVQGATIYAMFFSLRVLLEFQLLLFHLDARTVHVAYLVVWLGDTRQPGKPLIHGETPISTEQSISANIF